MRKKFKKELWEAIRDYALLTKVSEKVYDDLEILIEDELELERAKKLMEEVEDLLDNYELVKETI
jgi:hypothetical protein